MSLSLRYCKVFFEPIIRAFKEQPGRFMRICEEKPEWLKTMASPEETEELKAKMRELLEEDDMEPAAIDYFISVYTDVAYKGYLEAKSR